MNRSQKATLGGIVLAVAVMVFVPSLYVSVATKMGKLAELRNAGGV